MFVLYVASNINVLNLVLGRSLLSRNADLKDEDCNHLILRLDI